ncbi:MAG: prephenate dehydrogenase/arogenate dehydrogenase family protein [Verrucomicrobiales bacterium]|jgi:prephenate dehydrogenase|nr:prephenate dehydrogenase/arogenate dehydrogenase family protein [Verrucomicrobiales bacterium]
MQNFNTITVIAPGLLGGSILKTLRKKSPQTRLKVYARREETRLTIGEEQLADDICSTLEDSVKDSDLVILCTPIQVMPEIVQQILPVLKNGAVVTDVGSVKAPVHTALSPVLKGKAHWIGSHPMAGGENSGIESARDNLFDKAITVLTPTPDANGETVNKLRSFWEMLGSKTITLTPEIHDAYVAQISHMPHLLAAILVNAVSPESLQVVGPGFRDTSRIAAGPPDMWVDILKANNKAVISALKKVQAETQRALEILEQGDTGKLQSLLADACKKRRSI